MSNLKKTQFEIGNPVSRGSKIKRHRTYLSFKFTEFSTSSFSLNVALTIADMMSASWWLGADSSIFWNIDVMIDLTFKILNVVIFFWVCSSLTLNFATVGIERSKSSRRLIAFARKDSIISEISSRLSRTFSSGSTESIVIETWTFSFRHSVE